LAPPALRLFPQEHGIFAGWIKIEDEAYNFSEKVIDLNRFLVEIIDIEVPANKSKDKEQTRVTYHDPCHLANAQGIKEQPP